MIDRQQRRHDEDVDRVEACQTPQRRKRSAKEELGRDGTGPGDRTRDREADPGRGHGIGVIWQRVADEPGHQRQAEEHDPHDPVDFARFAIGAGEEDPQEVQQHRGHHQVGGPVVRVAEEVGDRDRLDQTHAGVGLRQRLAVDRDLRIRRHVDESKIDAGEDEDDEGEERHLAQEEARMHRERLAPVLAVERADAEALVEPAPAAV